MGLPARNLNEDDDRKLSAAERAERQWGMDPSSEPKNPNDDDTKKSARERADESWGMNSGGESDTKDGGLYNPSGDSDERAALDGSKPDSAMGVKELYAGGDKGGAKRIIIEDFFRKKGIPIIGGGAGAIMIIMFLFVSFFSINKTAHIIEDIENKVGNVPEYAVERRLEYYMSRYLILRQLAKAGVPEATIQKEYVYLSKKGSTFDTLYTNWKGAKLEGLLESEYGVRLQPRNLEVNTKVWNREYAQPNRWEIEIVDAGKARAKGINPGSLNSIESRKFINILANKETRSFQVLKRYNVRKNLKKYNGIDGWKQFAYDKSEKYKNATDRYREGKKNFKKKTIENTIKRVNVNWGNYMICLIDGDPKKACKDIRKGKTPSTEVGSMIDESELTGVVDEALDKKIVREGAEEAGERAGKEITQKVTASTVKKFSARAIPVVGWVIGASHLINSADNGILSQVIYQRNATQYGAFGAGFMSGSDQIKSGIDIDGDDARVLNETFTNYEQESQVYRASRPGYKIEPGKKIKQDCNNDGDTTDADDFVTSDDPVCASKKILQPKETFTEDPAWEVVAGLSQKLTGEDSWIKSVIDVFEGGLATVMEKTGISAGIAYIIEETGADKALAEKFQELLAKIAAPVITGAESGGSAYDALFASISVQKSSLGGGVGENREDTIGGAVLSMEEVAQIKEDQYDKRQLELRGTEKFARYFSPDIPESLTSQAVMALPSSSTQTVSKFSSLLNPGNFIKGLASAFTSSAEAQNSQDYNFFNAIYYGYPSDSDVFNANDGSGMEHDELYKKYKCDEPIEKRQENSMGNVEGIPFKVAVKVDPCLLEKAVEDAGSRYFTGAYDEGIDEGSKRTSGGQTGLLNPGGLAWPTKAEGSHISSCFNEPRSGGPHKGMDIAIAADTPAFAVADGEVIIAGGKADGYGPNYVAIKHTKADGTTFVSGYGHMNSKTVEVGDKVTQAQQVGTIGSLGYSTGPHMHVIINVGGKDNFNGDVDPLTNGMEVPPGALNAKGCPKY